MDRTECPECGEQVPHSALGCMHCGALFRNREPIAFRNRGLIWKAVGATLALAGTGLIAVGIYFVGSLVFAGGVAAFVISLFV